jgi:hypothetical protein
MFQHLPSFHHLQDHHELFIVFIVFLSHREHGAWQCPFSPTVNSPKKYDE